MNFESSPLGLRYAQLKDQHQGDCPADKNLDDCELRANSKKDGDLRVKTGDRSGWSSKARKAHQTNAVVILGEKFTESLDVLLRESKGLQFREKAAIRDAGVNDWNAYGSKQARFTLGGMRTLHNRAVRVFNDNQPITPSGTVIPNRVLVTPAPTLPLSNAPSLSPATASASSSTSSSPALSSSLASSLSSSASSSSSSAAPLGWAMPAPPSSLSSPAASASPGSNSGARPTAALAALKAYYSIEKFPADHGENDAASPQMRQEKFHAKLDSLVKIAEQHAPILLNSAAEKGEYRVLKRVAQSMKAEPNLEPAVALYKQTVGATHARIGAVYQKQVGDYANSSEQRK